MKHGDIYFINIKGQEHVQTGLRPVIIVQNDVGNYHAPTTIVCAITASKKKQLPTHVYIGTSGGLKKPSTILCEHIYTVNKDDLQTYVGHISNPRILEELNRGILISLGVDKEYIYDKRNRSNKRLSNYIKP